MVLFIYNLLVKLSNVLLPFLGYFNAKIKAVVEGRNETMRTFTNKTISIKAKKNIWLHCASLGEFDQGKPVIERLIENNEYELYISFFSPSGYINKKKYSKAKEIFYLPSDTKANARALLDYIQPDIVLFVKYEIWYHFINETIKNKTPIFLISAVMNASSFYFNTFASPWYDVVSRLDMIFLQDLKSLDISKSKALKNCILTGDTRFDSVIKTAESAYENKILNAIAQQHKTICFGSCWQEELDIFYEMIGLNSFKDWTFIIAPHELKLVASIQLQLKKRDIQYYLQSQESDFIHTISNATVLIVDTIGQLSKIYRYATVALVGGGFRGTLHNILEPSAYGLPVFCGPQTHKFNEAQAMELCTTLHKIKSNSNFYKTLNITIENIEVLKNIQLDFINKNKGATQKVVEILKTY